MKEIYMTDTINYIAREKGIETANELVKSGTIKTILGETKETDVSYLVIEHEAYDNEIH